MPEIEAFLKTEHARSDFRFSDWQRGPYIDQLKGSIPTDVVVVLPS